MSQGIAEAYQNLQNIVMAEIEKGLPNEPELKVEDINTNETVEIPNEPKEKTDIEVTEMPDGGAEISFDPNAVVGESTSHFQNLADLQMKQLLHQVRSQLLIIKITEHQEKTGKTHTEMVQIFLVLNTKEEQNHLEMLQV